MVSICSWGPACTLEALWPRCWMRTYMGSHGPILPSGSSPYSSAWLLSVSSLKKSRNI